MRIVRSENGCTDLVRDVDEHRVGALLIWNTVVLKFDEEIVLAKNVLQTCRFLQCSLFVAVH